VTTAPVSTPAPRTAAPATTQVSASPPATTRSGAGTTPTSTDADAPTTRAPVIPNTSGGAITGINLNDDGQNGGESIEIAPRGVEAVRREQRAGPDQ
jgi:hypothetical protein